ncbi:MAG: transporter substrate-binding domain-containing protein [Clostridia bacterium]|nr:transporter substrate-binding domain-containing protein [Clostridia bacterium]
METKFNEDLQPKKKRVRRTEWQERLPIKPVLSAAVIVLLIAVLVAINRPMTTVLSSPELDVIRSSGVLRVGVDDGVTGMYQNGSGYERAIAEQLATLIFGQTEGVSFVPVDRYTGPLRLSDGDVDLVLMSMQSFPQEAFAKNAVPFFTDRCVILAYVPYDSLAGKTVAVLEDTPSETLLYQYLESVEPELVVHPAADYYSMRVQLRAGTVDAVCLPRTVAASWREARTQILSFDLGAIPYYAIAKKDSVLLEVCDEFFYDWQNDGTFRAWAKSFGVEWGANG